MSKFHEAAYTARDVAEHGSRVWPEDVIAALDALEGEISELDAEVARLTPRVMESAAELDALPVGSVVLTASDYAGEHDYAWVKSDDEYSWKGTYGNTARSATLLRNYGPATVLHEGEK